MSVAGAVKHIERGQSLHTDAFVGSGIFSNSIRVTVVIFAHTNKEHFGLFVREAGRLVSILCE